MLRPVWVQALFHFTVVFLCQPSLVSSHTGANQDSAENSKEILYRYPKFSPRSFLSGLCSVNSGPLVLRCISSIRGSCRLCLSFPSGDCSPKALSMRSALATYSFSCLFAVSQGPGRSLPFIASVLKALLHLFSLLFSHLGQKGKSRPYYSVLARSKDFPEKINLSSYIFRYSIRKVRFKKSHFEVHYQVNSLHILYHVSFSALHSPCA